MNTKRGRILYALDHGIRNDSLPELVDEFQCEVVTKTLGRGEKQGETLGEVAEHLGVHPRTLYLMRIKYDLMGDEEVRSGRKKKKKPMPDYSQRMTWGE